VRHHRPYFVAKSNKDVWYIMRCQISSCGWGVWLRRTSNEIHQWRVSRVKQPHVVHQKFDMCTLNTWPSTRDGELCQLCELTLI
jgi:hypothetical protein